MLKSIAKKGSLESKLDTVVGIFFLVQITVAALPAIPLMIVTHSGRP